MHSTYRLRLEYIYDKTYFLCLLSPKGMLYKPVIKHGV